MDTAVSEEFISDVTEGNFHYCQIAIFIRALPTLYDLYSGTYTTDTRSPQR